MVVIERQDGFVIGHACLLCLFYRRLDDGEPLVGILLIPDTVDVNGAGSSNNLVALFLQIGEKFDVVVVQFVIRAEDFQASRQRHDRDVIELDKSGVGTPFRDLLAILDVDVLRLVSAVFDGVASARFLALTAQTGHLGADYLAAEAADVLERRDDGTMAGHGDGRK